MVIDDARDRFVVMSMGENGLFTNPKNETFVQPVNL